MDIKAERLCVEKAKTDQASFGILFDVYYPKIANYILRRTGDIDAAQDITSVVFFKAWDKLPTYEWRGLPFSAWLYRIASNETNSYFRQNKLQPASLDALFEETGFEVPSEHDVESDLVEFQDMLDVHQDYQLVQRLLLELPLKYQEVLSLRFFEKKAIQEIADITGKNTNTVKSLLARGTAKLRQQFMAHKQMEKVA